MMIIVESLLPEIEKTCRIWYLDSSTFQQLYKDKFLFKDLRPICINFVIVAGQVIYIEQVRMVLIPFKNRTIDL